MMRNLWQPSEFSPEKNKEQRHNVMLLHKLKTEMGIKTGVPTNIIDNLFSLFMHLSVALSLSLLFVHLHTPSSLPSDFSPHNDAQSLGT